MNERWTAILISTLAGSATLIGGLSIFVVKKFKPMPYSACMALSAGVMTYVSFVEIFSEATLKCGEGLAASYAESGITYNPHATGYLLATCMFFCGWFFADLLHFVLNAIIGKCNLSADAKFDDDGNIIVASKHSQLPTTTRDVKTVLDSSTSSSDDSVVNKISEKIRKGLGDLEADTEEEIDERNWFMRKAFPPLTGSDKLAQDLANEKFKLDQSRFLQVGIFTALILGIHNIPEGMGTFTGYLADPSFGFSMAFAIGIHNIPEGISVAVPCYFGTGSAWKAILLSGISAIAEPIGGFLAWGILGDNPSDLGFGILFGLICGVMSNVAIKELLLSAISYDPANRVSMKFFVLGMAIMSTSLVAFAFVE